MARRSSGAMDYLRAIETLSESEEPLGKAVRQAGPGGEAYDRAPTRPEQPQGGKFVNFAEQAKRVLSAVTSNISPAKDVAQKTSQQAQRLQRRAAVFLKHNAVLLAGIAVFGASLFAARRYWRK